MELSDIKIRHYQIRDKKALREISLETMFLGKYRNFLFNDEILADYLTKYFTDYEPTSCFVATKKNQIIGYVMGSQEIKRMHKIVKFKIAPHLAGKVLLAGHLWQKDNLIFIKQIISSYLKGEFRAPDFSSEYPATLHINIATQYRRQHLGSVMIEYFLSFLKKKGVKGVHFGVLSEEAKRFFLKLNFDILFTGKYSFLKYLTGKDIPHYIMGKYI